MVSLAPKRIERDAARAVVKQLLEEFANQRALRAKCAKNAESDKGRVNTERLSCLYT